MDRISIFLVNSWIFQNEARKKFNQLSMREKAQWILIAIGMYILGVFIYVGILLNDLFILLVGGITEIICILYLAYEAWHYLKKRQEKR